MECLRDLGIKKDDFSHDLSNGVGNEVFVPSENRGFDSGSDARGRVFDTRKHTNAKFKPEYRRVVKNFKSPKKYWQERKRRKQVLELLENNFSVKQIAVKLGVSERTVKRDIAKIKPYYERRIRHSLNFLRQEQQQVEFGVDYEKLSPREKLKQLRFQFESLKMQIKQLKQREYLRHQLLVTIDLDDLTGGFPKIIFYPQMPLSAKLPFNINFAFKKNGVTTQVQGWCIGK